MSETATANPPSGFPWTGLLRWQPFQIDALGLITLLGAEEVSAAVGRLVRSTWLEYLPLLGAYVIANQRFREKEAGYHIYNISSGIHTTDIASWFSRWIKAQDFEQTRSFVRWTYEPRPETVLDQFGALVLSCLSLGFLVAMTVLSYDWYGFANALAMASSVITRHYMVSSLRDAIDKRVTERFSQASDGQPIQDPGNDAHLLDRGWLGKSPSKVLIITSDARAVTMLIPEELLKPPSAFIANLQPGHRFRYSIMRWSGWVAFAVQVVTIGMSDLATQLVTVFLLVVPTVLHVGKLGCDDSQWWPLLVEGWKWFFRKLLPRNSTASKRKFGHDEEAKGSPASQTSSSDQCFRLKYVCWIGKHLKAEVYEWPRNHRYDILQADPGTVKAVRNTHSPSDKRQHLYAWLQLTEQETDSMDKWDLFPHRRGDNDGGWLKHYEAGKAYISSLEEDNQSIMTPIRRAAEEAPSADANANKGPSPQGLPFFPGRDPSINPVAEDPVPGAIKRADTRTSLISNSAMYVSQDSQMKRERRLSLVSPPPPPPPPPSVSPAPPVRPPATMSHGDGAFAASAEKPPLRAGEVQDMEQGGGV